MKYSCQNEKGKFLCWDTVKCAVLQGCVLVPLLLNIYINDFPKIINKLSHTILFAEGTSIVVISTNYIKLNQRLNCNLHLIFKWFQTRYLVLNANQAYTVKFTSSKSLIYPFTITYVNQILAIAEKQSNS